MSNELHNELMSQGIDYEPEGSPEELEAAAAQEEPTGTEPAAEPEGTAPGEETPEGTAEAQTDSDAVDDEPMTNEQMRETIKKLNNQVNSMQRRLSKQARAGRAPIVPPEPLDESTAPKVEDFTTIEDFNKAYDNWSIDQRVAEGIRKATAGAVSQDAQAARAEFVRDTFSDGSTAYPDFQEVVGDATLPITVEMIDAINTELDSEVVNPEDMFYYLGKNRAEAAAMSRMAKPQLARAIAKIEARLELAKGAATKSTPKKEAAPKKTVTSASAPIKPTDSTVIVHKDPEKMSQAEYEAWRNGKS